MHVEMSFLEMCQCFLLCVLMLFIMASPIFLFKIIRAAAQDIQKYVFKKKPVPNCSLHLTPPPRRGSKHNPVYHTELDDDDFI